MKKRAKAASSRRPTGRTKVQFELMLGDEAVSLSLELPTAPTPARRMLPVFQTLTHEVIDAGVAEVTRRGETVSCRAGCGACCRQSVPISLTEARQLAALVEAMPEPRRSQIRARFADATARLEAAGMLDELRRLDAMPNEWHAALHPRYFALGIPCPFLEEESCSIHPDRPLICREYLVTSSPEHCAEATTQKVRRVPLHGQVSTDIVLLEYVGPTASRVVLVLALEWAREHEGDEPAPRPPIEWLSQVLEKGREQLPEP